MRKDRYGRITTGYKKYIDSEELKQMDSFFSEQIPQIQCAYLFSRFLGLRRSDAVRVRIDNIQNGMLEMIQFKTGYSIQLPVKEEVLDWLKSYIKIFQFQIHEHQGYLCFAPPTGRGNGLHITPSSLTDKYSKFRKEHPCNPYYVRTNGNPLYRLTNHALRHNVIDHVYRQTKDIKAAQAVAGHVRADTTMNVYVSKPAPADLKEPMQSLK